MTLGQIILVLSIVLLTFYVFYVRSQGADRLLMMVMAAGGLVLVLFPDLSNRVAREVGIGRGADLLFYLFIVFCMFRFAAIAAAQRDAQRSLTEVVRRLALLGASVARAAEDEAGERDAAEDDCERPLLEEPPPP